MPSDQSSGWTARGASRLWAFAGCSALYLIPACLVAARRPLWHDEVYTLYLARLPALSDVWAALAAGTDLVPPFFYVVTRAVLAVFGESSLTLRLPAVLGTWIMLLSVLAFVSRRAGFVSGLLAMLFALTTHVAHYSYEARPSGLVGGFAGLALVSWQWATDGRRRPLALVGLALGLAAAIATHYYATLLVIPFALAEAVRARARERLDLAVWIALAAGMTPLAVQAPLFAAARPYMAAFWATPRWGAMIEFYEIALGPAAAPLAALLVVAALAAPTRRAGEARGVEPPPLHEAIVAAGVAVMPVVAVVVVRLTTGALSTRYVLWAVIGVAVLFGWAAHAALDGRRSLTAALALVLVVTIARDDAATLRNAATHRGDQAAVVAFLIEHAAPDRPIVVDQPGEYLELAHAAPRALGARLVYLVDLEASRRHLAHDTADRGLLALRDRAPLRVVEYAAFAAAHRSLQVYARDGRAGWLLAALPAADVKLRARRGPCMIFDVQLSGPPSSAGRESPERSS